MRLHTYLKIFSLSSSSIPMHWYPPFLCDQRLPKDRIGNLSVFFEDLLTLFLQPPLASSPFGSSAKSSSLGPLVFYLNQFHLQVSLLHNSHFDCLRYHPQKIHRSNYLTPFLHFVLNILYHVIVPHWLWNNFESYKNERVISHSIRPTC